jgi:hypothetical protein
VNGKRQRPLSIADRRQPPAGRRRERQAAHRRWRCDVAARRAPLRARRQLGRQPQRRRPRAHAIGADHRPPWFSPEQCPGRRQPGQLARVAYALPGRCLLARLRQRGAAVVDPAHLASARRRSAVRGAAEHARRRQRALGRGTLARQLRRLSAGQHQRHARRQHRPHGVLARRRCGLGQPVRRRGRCAVAQRQRQRLGQLVAALRGLRRVALRTVAGAERRPDARRRRQRARVRGHAVQPQRVARLRADRDRAHLVLGRAKHRLAHRLDAVRTPPHDDADAQPGPRLRCGCLRGRAA